MFNRLVIIGAGGHGKVISGIAVKIGYINITFVDDNAVGFCMNYPIICKSSNIEMQNDGNTDIVISVGNNEIRKQIAERHQMNWVMLTHSSSQIGADAKIGVGTFVMAGVVVVKNIRESATYIGIPAKRSRGGTSNYLFQNISEWRDAA